MFLCERCEGVTPIKSFLAFAYNQEGAAPVTMSLDLCFTCFGYLKEFLEKPDDNEGEAT